MAEDKDLRKDAAEAADRPENGTRESGGRNFIYSFIAEDIAKDNDPRNVAQKESIEQIIENAIRNNNRVTRAQIARIAGVSEKTIGRRIKGMNHIVFIGKGDNGHWEIISEDD